MAKVNVSQTIDEIVSINNQITGLKLLLDHKKALMAKFFEKYNKKQIQNEDATVYVQERTNIEYNIEELENRLDKKLLSQILEKSYTVVDWPAFTQLCKNHGISPKVLRNYISVVKKVDQNKLSKLYEKGEVELTDLEGCYTATTKKSIALRMKNVEQEIPISKK